MTIITTTEELEKTLSKMLPGAIAEATRANPEKLFTKSEAAKILGKERHTIRRMIKENRIQPTADGKYISQRAINEYLTGRK